MKRTAYLNPRSAARLVMAAACTLILAAACTTDDDPLRPAADDDRPVPFTFTAVAPPAMTDANTRAVPGNDTWKGDGTEKIWVRIDGTTTFKSTTGIYTVISPEGKTAVLPGDEPALWPSMDIFYEISAWYPALEPGKECNISDQSTPEKLREADMLRFAAGGFTYDINFTPDLEFGHQMGKVRVELTGVDASATDIEVGIWGPTRFSLNDEGVVIGDHDNFKDYIKACRDTEDAGTVAFEAMLPTNSWYVPITKQNFIRIRIGDRTYYFTPGADSPDGLSYGYALTYTVDLSSPTTRTAAAVIPGNSTVIPGTKAVIPGEKAVIPGLTRDLPPRRAGLTEQEIAGQARNDRKRPAMTEERGPAPAVILNLFQDLPKQGKSVRNDRKSGHTKE